MKPRIIKYFWITFAIILILHPLLYLWTKADSSCNGFAMGCLSIPAVILVAWFLSSPIVLLIVSTIAMFKDLKNPGLSIEVKNSLKKGMMVFLLVLISGLIIRVIVYLNYHAHVQIIFLFLPFTIFLSLFSFLTGVLYIQYRLKRSQKNC